MTASKSAQPLYNAHQSLEVTRPEEFDGRLKQLRERVPRR
jgi:hypothetical protein